VPSESAAKEILKLKKANEDLVKKLEDVATSGPKDVSDLQQGDDKYPLVITLFEKNQYGSNLNPKTFKMQSAWDSMFAYIAPYMMDEAHENLLKTKLQKFFLEAFNQTANSQGTAYKDCEITDKDFQTIKVQMCALGLITKSERNRTAQEKGKTFWKLTSYGEKVMYKLRALRKQPA
jgi:hypothetical protein